MTYEPVGKFPPAPEDNYPAVKGDDLPSDARFFISADQDNPSLIMTSEILKGVFSIEVKNKKVIWDVNKKIEQDLDTQWARVKSGMEKEITYDDVLKTEFPLKDENQNSGIDTFDSFNQNPWAKQTQQWNIYT